MPSYSVNNMIQDFIRHTRWRDGMQLWPTSITRPTMEELLDNLREGELIALEGVPDVSHSSFTLTLTQSTPNVTQTAAGVDLLDHRIVRAVLLDASGEVKGRIRWIDWTRMLDLYPEWETSLSRTDGVPERIAIHPETKDFWVYPTPDAAYTVKIYYQPEPALFAPAEIKNFFIERALPSDQTIDAVDMKTTHCPRPCKIGFNTLNEGMNGTFSVVGRTYPNKERVQDSFSLTLVEGTTGESDEYFWEIESIRMGDWFTKAGGGVLSRIDVGFSGSYDTTTLGQSVTTNSLLPRRWAKLIGPVYAAALHLESSGDERQSEVLMARFEDSISRMAESYRMGGVQEAHVFGRDGGGWRPTNTDPWGLGER